MHKSRDGLGMSNILLFVLIFKILLNKLSPYLIWFFSKRATVAHAKIVVTNLVTIPIAFMANMALPPADLTTHTSIPLCDNNHCLAHSEYLYYRMKTGTYPVDIARGQKKGKIWLYCVQIEQGII